MVAAANVSETSKSRSRNTKIVECSKTLVTQVKWCWLGRTAVIAVTSNDTVRVIDATGTRNLLSYAMTTDNVSAFYRGLTSCTVDSVPMLFVGTSVGDILVLSDKGELLNTLVGNGCSITELTSHADGRVFDGPPVVVSGDEAGVVTVWDVRSITAQATLFGGEGIPCTCVRISDDMVVATFANGMIRFFSLATSSLVAELAAHSRCITALVLTKDKLAVTVGYDSLAQSFDFSNPLEIRAVFAIDVPSSLLQGVAAGADADMAVVAYDSHRVRLFKPR
eukprot:c10436_g1_i2.p2 GENE.c10436_g1_i2~~c10436_g1_i2.p2  ORF type:complete len:279 (-),score=49.32 c10436_g1_i2:14-850(-)